MLTAASILACLVVLALSLYAEHQDARHIDTVIFTVGLMLSLATCLVGDIVTKALWPKDIRPMVAVAAFTDAALTALYISRLVRARAFYKLLLAFIGSGMCVVHTMFLLKGDYSRSMVVAWWATANINFALSLLIIGSQGGGVVYDLVRRRLSRLLGGRGALGHVKVRGEQ